MAEQELPPEVAEAIASAQGAVDAAGEDGPQEVPSVFSTIHRYLVGRVDVTPPEEDGSRTVRLFSGNGGTIIEASLSPQLCEFVAGKLTEVQVISAADEEEESADAGHGED